MMRYLFDLENEKSVIHGNGPFVVGLVLLVLVVAMFVFVPEVPFDLTH